MTNSARDLIMGNSCPAMTFNDVGAEIVGKILTEPKAVQQTVYDPRNPQNKTPAFWPSGDPKMQVVFQVQTQWRNYEGIKNPDRATPDDGRRTVFLKGKFMERATADAVRAAGADWLDVGGMIWYRYIGEDMTSLAGAKPKMFEARYQAPAPQPPAHFNQQAQQAPGGYGQQQGYPDQWSGQPGRHVGPQVPQPPQQNWQQAGWGTQQPQQQWTAQQTVPSHHGQPDQMPAWAQTSAPPSAQSSSPPAPALSTLDLIRQGQTGSSDSYPVEPAF